MEERTVIRTRLIVAAGVTLVLALAALGVVFDATRKVRTALV
jgi:hypothetical protein